MDKSQTEALKKHLEQLDKQRELDRYIQKNPGTFYSLLFFILTIFLAFNTWMIYAIWNVVIPQVFPNSNPISYSGAFLLWAMWLCLNVKIGSSKRTSRF